MMLMTSSTHGSVRYGYKASAEQFPPRRLVDLGVSAERHGFDIVAVSDHFQPWRHHGGHAPNSLIYLAALGEQTERVVLATSVLTPTLRYQPAVIAQAFATLACLNPGRVILGIGTGEAMNENPSIGIRWPKFKERSERLAEAVALIRELWSGERITFEGAYYRTLNATIYDRPEQPVPIFVAAGGPKAAALAGEIGDGLIVTSGKGEELYHTLLAGLAEGATRAGREVEAIERFIEIKVSYDHDAGYAMHACEPWAALALTAEEKGGTEDPIEMERLAEAARDRAHTRFIVSDDPDQVVEQVALYVGLGFRDLVFHFPGEDQERAIAQFAADVLPRLRERWG
jgi:coenzyme F420-dependent glucose-6-phosphate dehydrogenase